MPNTPNPLSSMTDANSDLDHDQLRPDQSFLETALPGFKQALNARRAIREYDGNPVPETIMKDCLDDAILAPTSSNLQTYELYWVRDKNRKNKVAEACLGQSAALTAGELVVVVARGDLWRRNLHKLIEIMTCNGSKPMARPMDEYYNKIVPMLMKTDAFGFYNLVRRAVFWYKSLKSPFIRTPVNKADHRVYAHIQATFVAQTLMLSLSAHGVESCPIGGMDKVSIAKALALPKSAEVSLVIAAGYGKPEGLYGPRVRLPEADLIKEV